jgi:hypothetical protein
MGGLLLKVRRRTEKRCVGAGPFVASVAGAQYMLWVKSGHPHIVVAREEGSRPSKLCPAVVVGGGGGEREGGGIMLEVDPGVMEVVVFVAWSVSLFM